MADHRLVLDPSPWRLNPTATPEDQWESSGNGGAREDKRKFRSCCLPSLIRIFPHQLLSVGVSPGADRPVVPQGARNISRVSTLILESKANLGQ